MTRAFSSAIAMLSLLLLFSAVLAAPTAPDYTKAGVKLGDTAVYRSSFTFSSDNKTIIFVYGLVGTVVFLNYTTYTPSGSVGSSALWGFDFQIGAPMEYRYFLVAANLSVGDPIYSGAPEVVITTTTMTIAGAARAVNIFSGTGVYVRWDRVTGLMVELHLLGFGWYNYTLISTNAWSPDTSPGLFNMTTILLILAVVVICVLVIALVYVARRGRKKRRRK